MVNRHKKNRQKIIAREGGHLAGGCNEHYKAAKRTHKQPLHRVPSLKFANGSYWNNS